MYPKIVAILVSVVILFAVIDLIRRQKMTFKYSFGWLSVCFVVLFFAINDQFLKKIARFFGFALPSNFIFFLLLVFVIYLTLILTVYTNEQNTRVESLAQAIAILEHQFKKSREKNHKED